MKLYSSGEAAKLLGISRDEIQSAISRGGPKPEAMAGGRYLFTREEAEKIAEWAKERRRSVRPLAKSTA